MHAGAEGHAGRTSGPATPTTSSSHRTGIESPTAKISFSGDRRVCDEAGQILLWFHGLRRAAVHSLADSRCTVPGSLRSPATELADHPSRSCRPRSLALAKDFNLHLMVGIAANQFRNLGQHPRRSCNQLLLLDRSVEYYPEVTCLPSSLPR